MKTYKQYYNDAWFVSFFMHEAMRHSKWMSEYLKNDKYLESNKTDFIVQFEVLYEQIKELKIIYGKRYYNLPINESYIEFTHIEIKTMMNLLKQLAELQVEVFNEVLRQSEIYIQRQGSPPDPKILT